MRWTTAAGALGFALAVVLVSLPAARRLGAPEPAAPGQPTPPFSLRDANGETLGLHELVPPGTEAAVLVFWSPRCPVSRGYEARLAELAATTRDRGVRWYAVVASAEVTDAEIRAAGGSRGLTLEVLRDRGAVAARRLGVTTTPHAVIIDARWGLAYSGAIDSNLFGGEASRRPYLADALAAVLAGDEPAPALTRSFGTSLAMPEPGLARLGPDR